MNTITENIDLCFDSTSEQVISSKKDDNLTRILKIRLSDCLSEFVFTDDLVIKMYIKFADNDFGEITCALNLSENNLTAILTSEMLKLVGRFPCEISIRNVTNTSRMTSDTFYLDIA